MDLLGSILSSMDKPPTLTEKEKGTLKEQKLQVEKLKIEERKEMSRFRKFVEGRIGRFSQDDRKFIEFQPLEKIYRTIVHDVADVAGLIAMSFGQEGIDRHTIVYKKEFVPKEDEILARRNGEDWNDDKAKEYAQKRLDQKIIETEENKPPEKIIPISNYKDKYAHLIGQDAALEAAKKTQTNKNYGFVPSVNKKDIRSIEQTMADIQAKKRLKIQQQSAE